MDCLPKSHRQPVADGRFGAGQSGSQPPSLLLAHTTRLISHWLCEPGPWNRRESNCIRKTGALPFELPGNQRELVSTHTQQTQISGVVFSLGSPHALSRPLAVACQAPSNTRDLVSEPQRRTLPDDHMAGQSSGREEGIRRCWPALEPLPVSAPVSLSPVGSRPLDMCLDPAVPAHE